MTQHQTNQYKDFSFFLFFNYKFSKMLDAIRKDGNGGYIVPTGSTVNITINITLEGASSAKLAQEASRVTQEIKDETSRVVEDQSGETSRVVEDQSGETSRVYEI